MSNLYYVTENPWRHSTAEPSVKVQDYDVILAGTVLDPAQWWHDDGGNLEVELDGLCVATECLAPLPAEQPRIVVQERQVTVTEKLYTITLTEAEAQELLLNMYNGNPDVLGPVYDDLSAAVDA